MRKKMVRALCSGLVVALALVTSAGPAAAETCTKHYTALNGDCGGGCSAGKCSCTLCIIIIAM